MLLIPVFNLFVVTILLATVKDAHQTSTVLSTAGTSRTGEVLSTSDNTGSGSDSDDSSVDNLVIDDNGDSGDSTDDLVFDQTSNGEGGATPRQNVPKLKRVARSTQSVIVHQASGPEGSKSNVVVSQDGATKSYGSPSTIQIDFDENRPKPCFESFFCLAKKAASFFTL